MKEHFWMLIVGVFALSGIEAASATDKEVNTPPQNGQSSNVSSPPVKKNTAQWKQKMQELYQVLAEITTDTSSDDRFNAKENRSRIEKNTKKLVDRAHDLGQKGLSPDSDPSVKMLAGLFQEEAKRAYTALQHGNRSYAKSILRQISSYCIDCHTRNQSGPHFPFLALQPTVKNLSPIESGRFYAATRQYDRAFDLFLKILDDQTAPIQRPLEWEQAVRYGLTLAVRVKKDPDQARALVERVIGSKEAPFFMKQDALKWKESILKWKEEIPRRALTEEGLRVEAMQLISQAREMQKYPMDHSADVLYLRATAVVHELLQKDPNGKYTQDAFLMAGMSYDVLKPLALEDIHEIYYEACIKKAPHTTTAEMCYRRYEQSTYEGYTGSGGTFLPEDVKRKLKSLETLAHPPIESTEGNAPRVPS